MSIGPNPKGKGWQVNVARRVDGEIVRAPRIILPTREEAKLWHDRYAKLLHNGASKEDFPKPGECVIKPKGPRAKSRETLGGIAEHVFRTRYINMKSARSAESAHNVLLTYFGADTPVSGIDSDAIEGFEANMEARGNSVATRNRYMVALGVLLKAAKEKGLIEDVPRFKMKTEYSQRLRWFGEDEIRSIFEFFADDPDMYDLCMVALGTGFRLGELRKACVSDYNTVTKKLTTWETKGNKARSVPCTPLTIAAIKRRSKGKGPHDRIFDAATTTESRVRNRMNAWKNFVGLSLGDRECTFHTFRHTFCTILIQDRPLHEVQRVMGHADIATTMRYSHLAKNDFEKTREVMAAAMIRVFGVPPAGGTGGTEGGTATL